MSENDSEVWRPRAIGSDYRLRCFVTGEERDLMPNISGFVTSKESGERVVAMFGGLARLDFRPSEPNWIQVKVGALPEHMPALQDLYRYASISGRIAPKAIAAAKSSSPFAEITKLTSQLAEARAALTWRPIETAPKDHTLFLAGCPACDKFPNGRVMVWSGALLSTQNKFTPRHLRYPATHWMPLPHAPGEARSTFLASDRKTEGESDAP